MGTGIRKRPGTTKVATNYFSHEFVIQNHGDIATCFSMVFIMGLMFQFSTPLASAFITPAYNVTELTSPPVSYTYGPKDICLIFFYSIIAIIFHAVVQEYILDKIIPKSRLSKTKERKFNESGQLFAFYLGSVAWIFFIFKEAILTASSSTSTNDLDSATTFGLTGLSFSDLWTAYPHVALTFLTKFFFILQLAYWVHVAPELYFTKVKREDMPAKLTFAAINFAVCAGIYLLNLTPIGLVLLCIDHACSALFHLSRLFYIAGKGKLAKSMFKAYNVAFVVARLAAICLSIFVFWFGLKGSSIEKINFTTGNFNTPMTRFTCLFVALALQAWMLWNFILFHCKKIRENKRPIVSSSKSPKGSKSKKAATAEQQQQQQVASDSGSDINSEQERDLTE